MNVLPNDAGLWFEQLLEKLSQYGRKKRAEQLVRLDPEGLFPSIITMKIPITYLNPQQQDDPRESAQRNL